MKQRTEAARDAHTRGEIVMKPAFKKRQKQGEPKRVSP